MQIDILNMVRSRVGAGFDRPVGARGEFVGPCPLCGGGGKRDSDRFHVFVDQPPSGPLSQEAGVAGGWWCRKCEQGGDVVDYLQRVEGWDWERILAALGLEGRHYDPPPPRQSAANPPPKPATPRASGRSIDRLAPVDLPPPPWRDHAARLVDECAEVLTRQPSVLQWLAGRGVTREMAARFRLGWVEGKTQKGRPPCLYRQRNSWGLPDKQRPNGSVSKVLWIPQGLLIPKIRGGEIVSLRIRQTKAAIQAGGAKYIHVDGGRAVGAWIWPTDARAYVVVEAELDAMAVLSAAVPDVGAVAMGSLSAYPDAGAHQILNKALAVLVTLDFEPQSKSASDGSRMRQWWLSAYERAKRAPVPVGKDPGEMVATVGLEGLAAWIRSMLPPALQLETPPSRPAPSPKNREGLPDPIVALQRLLQSTDVKIWMGLKGGPLGYQGDVAATMQVIKLLESPLVRSWCEHIGPVDASTPFCVDGRNVMNSRMARS